MDGSRYECFAGTCWSVQEEYERFGIPGARGWKQGLQDYLMTHLEDWTSQQHQTELSDPYSISESPHRPLTAVFQCQVLASLPPFSLQGGHIAESAAGMFPR